MGRILGVDYGEKRIGLAVSDPTGFLATPLDILDATQPRVVERLLDLCRERDIHEVVVGLPLNMDGSTGPQAKRVQDFAQKLRAALPDRIIRTWDERLTSRAGERVLIEAGASRKRRREVLDKLAAQIMLQSYLDAHGPES